MFPYNNQNCTYDTSSYTPTLNGTTGVGYATSVASSTFPAFCPSLVPPPILPFHSKPYPQTTPACMLRQIRPLKRLNNKATPNYRSLYIQAGKRIYPPRSPSTVLNDILGYQAVFEFTSVVKNHINCQTIVDGKCYSVSHKENKKEAKEALADKIIPTLVKEREDETPWASVCSLALYKLYEEWTKNGFKVPEKLYRLKQDKLIQHDKNIFPKVSPKLLAVWKQEEAKKTGKVMPENPTSRNPIQLLNEIRSKIKFNTVPTGTQSNIHYVSCMEIDGVVYSGKSAK
ncbi:unnamed protein product [Lepeophtheirus salmonis]|uniref:(salmon louse) hypothetical protein n=1 Tax=Lepeophtheirus salmonis TaxID=72036 RepID=A0A7R8CVC0_LEPSM|nr:unnamed protein product [Lepeophtheirus salmonis]CAF2943674.1 unnamed protein product [Lepeophtheirus salmonis]